MDDRFKTQEVEDGATQKVAQQQQSETAEAEQQSETQEVEESGHFDAEYVRKLRAEAAENRKKLREIEAKVKAEEEAKMTEHERLQKRLTELEYKEAEYLQSLQARTLEYEVKLSAAKLGIIDPEAAYKLLDLKQIEFDEDGKPTNVEKVIRELITKKPYLAGNSGSFSAGNHARNRSGEMDAVVIAARRAAGLPVEDKKS